jgi:hypothetical protein
MNGYETITIPPPFGSGNLNRMNRPVMQFSTSLLPIEEDLMEALETVPSFAMTNLTVIFPPRSGFLVSWRW